MNEFILDPLITSRGFWEISKVHQLDRSYFHGKTVVDLGIGKSQIAQQLCEAGVTASVIGVDQSERAIEYQRRTGTKAVQAELTMLPIKDESADIVIATYSFPFWAPTPDGITQFYSEIKRITKPGGVVSLYPLEVSYINMTHPEEDWMALLSEAVYLETQSMKDSPDWSTYRQHKVLRLFSMSKALRPSTLPTDA